MGYREKAGIRDLKGKYSELLTLLRIFLGSCKALSQSRTAALDRGTVLVVNRVVTANQTLSQYPRAASRSCLHSEVTRKLRIKSMPVLQPQVKPQVSMLGCSLSTDTIVHPSSQCLV